MRFQEFEQVLKNGELEKVWVNAASVAFIKASNERPEQPGTILFFANSNKDSFNRITVAGEPGEVAFLLTYSANAGG